MLKSLWNDEAGVILSAELVLIATILVLGMVVGLVELQAAVVGELGDLASAFGNLDQSYVTSGFDSTDGAHIKAFTRGAGFADEEEFCDCTDIDINCDDAGEK
jgi:Flp pilus assembly pilin Flp